MTKPAKKKDGSHLAADILAALKREPSRSIKALAAELGFTPFTVGKRLSDLLYAGAVDFVKTHIDGSDTPTRLWHVCNTPRELPLSKPFRAPVRVTIRRDWAVEALFGPAHKEAA